MAETNNIEIIGLPGDEYHQQYPDTCAIKSQQIILNEFGIPVTEEQLVDYSFQHGWYNRDGNGTASDDVGKLLVDAGIPIHRQENANVFDLVSELAQGHKVIVGVDSSELWTGRFQGWLEDFFNGEQPDHALIVSGIDTSDPNNVLVRVTDPGTGEYNRSYPLDVFMDAWADSNSYMVATDIPAPENLVEMSNFDYALGHIENVAGLPYIEFDIFHDISTALPVNVNTDAGIYSPMCSLVDAYSDVAMQRIDFAHIFNNYEFVNFLDSEVVLDNFHEAYNNGMNYINFSPEVSWETYSMINNVDVCDNNVYADFLCDSIGYFEAVNDYESYNYCTQQLLILDYCDYSDINFYDTFYC